MDKSIIQKAASEENWIAFLNYKKEKQHLQAKEEKEIQEFIDRKAYLDLCQAWKKGCYPSDFPVKTTVNKSGTNKKRTVYSFQGDDGIFLKFIAFQLYRYDEIFCENCYAFRR